jgi:uncharacterized membrane protein YjjP (DUF1212 family)
MARGLGCTWVEIYCQHSAITLMLQRGSESITHMGKIGEHGVNLRGGEAVLKVASETSRGQLSCAEALARLEAIPASVHRYPLWLTCAATGLACAAFGRLLGMDWPSFLPVWAGAAIGQWIRVTMFARAFNLYFVVVTVAFSSAFIAGWGSRLLGGTKFEIATIAATLLLIPGPAMLNTQMDALDGKPNLAVARAFRIGQIIIFLTLGLIGAQRLIGM